MRRRKYVPTYPADWTVSTEYVVNGRHLNPGTEVSIRGERGRFRFIKVVERPGGVVWLDFVGGTGKYQTWRSFRPERVKRVHWKNRTRQNTTEESAA